MTSMQTQYIELLRQKELSNTTRADNNKKIQHKNHSKENTHRQKYDYVTIKEAKPARDNLEKLLKDLHNDLKEYFTFIHKPIGSSSRNMITKDIKGNTGYDFDIDIIPQKLKNGCTTKDIRNKFFNSLKKYRSKYGYSKIENSTSVITIKDINHNKSEIKFSCDFAITRKPEDGQKEVLMLDKNTNQYIWAKRGNEFKGLGEKFDWLKKNGYLKDLRTCYLYKKNTNIDKNKHSRSLFAEAVNEIWKKAQNNKLK